MYAPRRHRKLFLNELFVQLSGLRVAAIPVPRAQAGEFGVVEVNDESRIMAFHDKKADAPTMPDDFNRVYASMGNYIFSTRTLMELLEADAKTPGSHHDFGMDILPKLARVTWRASSAAAWKKIRGTAYRRHAM